MQGLMVGHFVPQVAVAGQCLCPASGRRSCLVDSFPWHLPQQLQGAHEQAIEPCNTRTCGLTMEQDDPRHATLEKCQGRTPVSQRWCFGRCHTCQASSHRRPREGPHRRWPAAGC